MDYPTHLFFLSVFSPTLNGWEKISNVATPIDGSWPIFFAGTILSCSRRRLPCLSLPSVCPVIVVCYTVFVKQFFMEVYDLYSHSIPPVRAQAEVRNLWVNFLLWQFESTLELSHLIKLVYAP